jgi:hypothetical protein
MRKGDFPLSQQQASRTTPGGFGAIASPMWRHAMKNRQAFSPEQLRRLAQWLDLNCPTHAVTGSLHRGLAFHPEWPRNADYDPFNPLGVETLEGAGVATSVDGERLVKALVRLGQEQRAALLDWAAWRLDKDPFHARGNEQELHRLLIPMLTSQQPHIHAAAAAWLQRLHDGKAMPKDVDAWRAYYAATFGGLDLDLATLVEERILLVRTGVSNGAGYKVDGRPELDLPALEELLRQETAVARTAGNRLRVAVSPPAAIWNLYYSNSYSNETDGVRIFEDAKQAAWRVAGNCTVYPEGYVIRASWVPSKPAGKQ